MEYCIVKRESTRLSNALSELTKEVNQKLKEGWEPQGGVSIAIEKLAITETEWFYVCQAMVRTINFEVDI